MSGEELNEIVAQHQKAITTLESQQSEVFNVLRSMPNTREFEALVARIEDSLKASASSIEVRLMANAVKEATDHISSLLVSHAIILEKVKKVESNLCTISPEECRTIRNEIASNVKRISRLEIWRNGIVIGSTVVWFFICMGGLMLWDWCKQHVGIVISWLQSRHGG